MTVTPRFGESWSRVSSGLIVQKSGVYRGLVTAGGEVVVTLP